MLKRHVITALSIAGLLCWVAKNPEAVDIRAEQLLKSQIPDDSAADEVNPSRARPNVDLGPVSIRLRIPPPNGYKRIPARTGSFPAWLRELPVRPGQPAVRLYDGREKGNQNVHVAVLDVDVGSRNLQQCADAVIRLRAEYLFSSPCRDKIRFNFTSGNTAHWKDWRRGIRPTVRGNRVSWHQAEQADGTYRNFRRYLETVFTYAGSFSLSAELDPVQDATRPEAGDVFIEGGFPGHAVIVVDVAENAGGERVFLLAQSYMPAQDIHILRSFEDISPWYRTKAAGSLRTPEWGFSYTDLKRFHYSECDTAEIKRDSSLRSE